MHDLAHISSPSEWLKARRDIEDVVTKSMGAFPKTRIEAQVKTVDELDGPGYIRKRVNYFVSDWERISAWVFVPDGNDEYPALVCCHQRTHQGKDEAAGIEGDVRLNFAQRYVQMGYVTIAPDTITAGERVSPGLTPFDTKNFYKDSPKMSAAGKVLLDHMYAVDVLCESKRVDPGRIGVIGHGPGGCNALLLTAFDERVRACVASCAFTRFADDAKPERWVQDDSLVYWPKLKEAAQKRSFPFDWEHILSLAAPSPTLVISSRNDPILGNTTGPQKSVSLARNVYKLLGAEQALHNWEHNSGHSVTDETLEKADEWLERWL